MPYKIEGGLITGPKRGQCAGYIFNFSGKGAYDPTGKIKVGDLELTQAQVDAHNKILGENEIKAAIAQGRGLFYLSYETPNSYTVSNWSGHFRSPHVFVQKSFTPGFNCSTRRHVYFTGPDGKEWYGIQQGDNQMCRAKRLKNQK